MRRLLVGGALLTGAYVAVLAAGDLDYDRVRLAAALLPFWVVSLVVTAAVQRGPATLRRPVLTVLALAALVQLPGVFTAPHSSSDAYRYVWDGRVQLSGTSPYRDAPLDDRLAALRDPVLFPGLRADERSGYATAALPSDRDALLALTLADSRTLINRPRVPTIYPPLAQAWFAGVAAVTPWSAGTLGLQVASAALAVLIAAALAWWLQRRARDPRHALWWAWSPVVVFEAGNGAHVDVLAAALVVGAVLLATECSTWRATRWLAGVLVGAAAAVKLTPLVLLPAFMPVRRLGLRRSLPAPIAAVLSLAASYLPHLLVAGSLVLGFLPGYLLEEGGATRAGILRLVLPSSLVPLAIPLVMTLVAVIVLVRTSADAPQLGALALFGSLLLVTTPSYPWYAVPLVALAVLAQRLEWLAVAVAAYIAYAAVRVPPVPAVGYALAALVVLGVGLSRARRARARPPLAGTP